RWPSCRLWNIAPLFANEAETAAVEVISGACMLVRRDVFERAGMFTEDYFMYAEDLDLCYKVKQLGLKNYYVGEAEIVKHGGKSSSQASVNQWSTFMKLRAIQKFCTNRRGKLYGYSYRLAMGVAATARLMAILFIRTAAVVLRRTNSYQNSWSKWFAIFRWSFGIEESSVRTKLR